VSNYLYVHNWDKWQNYRKDRGTPPWIRVHRCIIREHKWFGLSDAQKAHLLCIWMVAADENGRIPNDASFIKSVCGLSDEVDLKLFIDKGFLDNHLPTIKRKSRLSTGMPRIQNTEYRIQKEIEAPKAPLPDELRLELSKVLDAEHVEAVLDHRRKKKAANTLHAIRLLAKEFSKCPDANAAADEMILRGWQSLKAIWLEKDAQAPPNGVRRNGTGWYIKAGSDEFEAHMRDAMQYHDNDKRWGMEAAKTKGEEYHVAERFPRRR
jgi:hypothetical protein